MYVPLLSSSTCFSAVMRRGWGGRCLVRRKLSRTTRGGRAVDGIPLDRTSRSFLLSARDRANFV